jgi:hypothetical protein
LNVFTHQLHNTQDHIIAIMNIIITVHLDKEYNTKFWLVKVLEKCVNNQYRYIILQLLYISNYFLIILQCHYYKYRVKSKYYILDKGNNDIEMCLYSVILLASVNLTNNYNITAHSLDLINYTINHF